MFERTVRIVNGRDLRESASADRVPPGRNGLSCGVGGRCHPELEAIVFAIPAGMLGLLGSMARASHGLRA